MNGAEFVERTQSSGPGQRIPGRLDRPARGRIRWFTPLFLLPIPVLIALGMQVRDILDEPAVVFGDCSASADVARKAVYLMDLRKPVDAAYASLPGDLLREVSIEIPRDTELSVYAVSPYAEAPRTLIGRLCKPYDNADLVAEGAKDGATFIRDCDDLPAQISASLRAGADAFCRQREGLRRRVDALVSEAHGRTATDAYLVEALEETSRDLADSSLPGSIYVFSDMKQHAKWYSHLDVAWHEWNVDEFAAARAGLPDTAEPVAPADGLAVKIFYVARTGSTAMELPRRAHKAFWQGYFGAVGPVFEDQPAMDAYAAESLMDIPTPMEIAAYEREQIRHRSEIVDRERAELEASRRALERERERFAERQRQVSEREDRLAERERELEARAGQGAGEPADGAETRAEVDDDPDEGLARATTVGE